MNDKRNLVCLKDVLQPKGYIRGPFGSALKRRDMLTMGIPVYEQQHAIYGNRNFRFFISEEKYNEMKRFAVQPNDLIISCSGTVGRVSKIRKEDPHGIISQALLLLRTDVDKIIPDYLSYFFKSYNGYSSIISRSSGSVQVNIARREVIERIPLLLPSIEVQKCVVQILSALDDKIELNRKINENLEQQTQALFKSWFVDFEPFGGEAPTSWKIFKFSEFLTVSTEKSNDSSFQMFAVTDNGIFPRNEKFKKNLSMKNAKFKVVRQTDLVFGMSREILNWGIMRQTIGGVSSAYNVYKVNSVIDSFYLESYIKTHIQYFKDLIRPASREGQGIDKYLLMDKTILMPTQEVLEEYYSIENVLLQMIHHILKENQRLKELRDALLPRLMSGELDVSNLDI